MEETDRKDRKKGGWKKTGRGGYMCENMRGHKILMNIDIIKALSHFVVL